ncbi:site-specific DNA-methyltransferase [Faecalibacterium prausnitzii]|uniref:Site-specific DNA-methyltransferase n=1 Tax=Faecalibacterium prausnitzii TaxID=853 RepID=A0A3E2U0V6_9FIRM|nr:site-specific DNA-methyltransferase [Faecalibacterium prausnitzii]RGB89872.1 site-specific DNA-methyltransferase [Faecalibacterium prausnitzii]
METLKMHSLDGVQRNIELIGKLFPNAITEVKRNGKVEHAIDFDVLRQELSGSIVEGREERYQFTWPDKKKAMLAANAPITATLRPVVADSVGKDGTPGGFDSENLYIEGDNLEVLKLLQETYLGKVKMIYIDPPYNTGNDFVYEDDFAQSAADYMDNSGQYDEEGNRLVTNTESNGRFHTDWLNMIYPRLKLAKDLLAEDGVIFISIDDNEIENSLKVCSEVFGKGNYLACFPRVTKKAGKTTEAIARNHDYLLSYAKSSAVKLYLPSHTDDGFKFSDEFIDTRGKYKLNQTLDYDSLQYSASLDYPITVKGKTFYPGQSYEKYLERQKGNHARADWAWRWSKELFEFGLKNGFIVIKDYESHSRIYTKTYQNCKIVKKGNGFQLEYMERTKAISTLEFIENEYSNDNSKKNITQVFDAAVFDYSKPVELLKTITSYATSTSDVVLDFFSGSATTAHAVMKLNAEDGGYRKFIMVQLPEKTDEKSEAYKAGYKNICEIGKERIRRAGRKIKEDAGLTAPADLDIGFRCLRLDESNMKPVYYTPEETQQQDLFSLVDNVKSDRTPEDLLFQVMLDLGVLLSSPIEATEIAGKKVFNVANGFLLACFDHDVTDETVKAIAQMKPYYAVFRDSSMANDSVATNFDQIFETYSPDTVRKVL